MANLILSQLRLRPALAVAGPVFAGAVSDVVSAVTDEQVIGSHTQPVVAPVQHAFARAQGSYRKFVGRLVRVVRPALTPVTAVAAGRGSSPFPAVGTVAPRPEVLREISIADGFGHGLKLPLRPAF